MAAPTKSWILRLLIAGVLLGLAYYLTFVQFRPVATVAPVVSGRAVNAVPGSVEVKAEYSMELKSESGGRIILSDIDPGKKVYKGDVLIQIDTGDIDLEIERTANEVAAARRKVEIGSTKRADYENKKDEIAAFERLTKLGNYPEVELEKRRRELAQLQQLMELEEVNNKLALDNHENTLKTKRREKEKMTIVAPTDGVIANVNLNARVGDLLGRDTAVGTLISSTRTVEAKVSEENFAGIRVGQKASVRFLGYGDVLYPAEVVKVLPTANAETQRYVVHIQMDAAKLPLEKLVPGLTGEVSIILGERDAATLIPRRALRGNEVLMVKSGRVELRKVSVGYLALNQAEITTGVEKGDEMIVENLDQFKPGMRVRTRAAK